MGQTYFWTKVISSDQKKVKMCELMIQTNGFKSILGYPDDFKFDLVVNEYLPGPCLLSLMHKFKYPPLVQVSAFNAPCQLWNLVGSLDYSASIPSFNLDYMEPTLSNRILNLVASILDLLVKKYYQLPQIDKIVRKVFPDMPYIEELTKRTKIVLMNSHPAVQLIEPMMPNVISVGGLHITKPKSLPHDLEEIIQQANKGVILFSLGTNVRSDSLGDERIKNIIKAMKEFPDYQFFWKFESKNMPIDVPNNVHIRKWLPQNDILVHPKIKLFISHSGLLSIQEAVYHGVPLIGFPVFADQFKNVNYMVHRGAAKRLSIADFTENELKSAIEEVLTDLKYEENMKKLSKVFLDQHETPLERAVWWIEWVLRNSETEVFENYTVHQGIFERHCYDIVIFLTLLFVCSIFVGFKVFSKRRIVVNKKKIQ